MAPAQKSNIALLTEGADYIRRAKKARLEQVEKIAFDDEARREYLTGFSKRKKAKLDEKKKRAKERDRQEHLEERRKAREELKERAKQNVKSVRAAMGLEEEVENDEEDSGEGSESGRKDEEREEFSDEDQLATVTIIDNFDPTTFQPIPTQRYHSESPGPSNPLAAETKPLKVEMMPASSGRAQSKAKKEREKLKEKKEREKTKSRSMETKSERRRGKAIEGKRRVTKSVMALERNGKQKGGKGGKHHGKQGHKGKKSR